MALRYIPEVQKHLVWVGKLASRSTVNPRKFGAIHSRRIFDQLDPAAWLCACMQWISCNDLSQKFTLI
jgi:hypothetical protein